MVRKFAVDRSQCLQLYRMYYFRNSMCAAAAAYDFDALVVVLLNITLLNRSHDHKLLCHENGTILTLIVICFLSREI